MTVTRRSAVGYRKRSSVRSRAVQAERQLDLLAGHAEQFSPSAFSSHGLLLSLLRAGGVSLRVYRADDRLVRGTLR